jgi:hypothetical protein
MMDGYGSEETDGMNEWQGKLKYSDKTCLSAALATADPIHDWTWSRTQAAAMEGRRLNV